MHISIELIITTFLTWYHACSRIVIILRSGFVLRNLHYMFPSLGFSFLLSVLREAAREVRDFLVPMFAVTYAFAILGIVLFGGLINKNPDRSQYEVGCIRRIVRCT